MAYDYRVQKAPVYIERINKRKTANNRLLCAFTSPPPPPYITTLSRPRR